MGNTAYLFQAVLICLWWISISVSEDIYQIFAYNSIGKTTFCHLLVPDIILLGLLSALRAYWDKRDLGLIILGAFAYATLFCINASLSSLDGAVPTLTMIFGLVFNIFLVYPQSFMKSSQVSSFGINLFKTSIQVVCFWALFLGILPFILLRSLHGWPLQAHTAMLPYALALFTACSVLGLASAFVMVKDGHGTPLPLDATNTLVVKGPYKFIRNPMAVAGFGQITAIAIAFLSLPIFIYGLVGAIAWHTIIRPIEEKDLAEKFGEVYIAYRQQVRCWLPRFH
jgi:protein-S-isoprenylcysteine O-methyltransferase Ste14